MHTILNRTLLVSATMALLAQSPALCARSAKEKAQNLSDLPVQFAPLPQDHELASIWNDPDFTRRLIGSYGFASRTEPLMDPVELATYREKVAPLVREDQAKAMAVLQDLVKPGATAVFDFTLGNLYFQNEDLTNAIKHFEAALVKYPDYLRAQKSLGFAYMRFEKYDQAIKPLTRTAALGGGDGSVFGLLGFAFMKMERWVSAESAYRQALIFEPDKLDFKLGLVKCSLAANNFEYALALVDELLKQYPERDNLWTLQANIYIQKEQPAKAAISLEMLRRLGKATSENLYLLGDLYMVQDSRDLALESYLQAVDKDAGQKLAKALRPAQILVGRGAWDEARALFEKIRKSGALSPEDELKLLKLESKVAMSNGRGEDAIKTLEQIIQKNPLDGEALLLAGDYYASNEKPEVAESRYDTASKLEGFQADACVKRAQLLVQSKKYTQAADFLRQAQKVKPRDNVQRYLEKVELLAGTGRSTR